MIPMNSSSVKTTRPSKQLLIVDDDGPLLTRLTRAMERKGFVVASASTVKDGIAAAKLSPPDYAVVDLRLSDGSGLDVVSALHEVKSDTRVVMLTGFGAIASAVAAIKAGAIDYLPKPSDADAIEAALLSREASLPPPPEKLMTAERVRWEHIQRVYMQCDRNVSETARRLRMHRPKPSADSV